MKILITGGCGFLGSNLAAKFLYEKKSELFIIDNLTRTGSKKNLSWLRSKGDFVFFEEDIRDGDSIKKIIKYSKPDAIFHLAGQVAMTSSILDPRNDFEVNALGSLNILEAVRKYVPLCIVIYSSTNKVYGDLESFDYIETDTRYVAREFQNGFSENIQLDFRSPYGCSKGVADQYMLDYHRIFGLRTVVFRHSSMYGGRQFSTYDQGWVGWFCQKAIDARNKKNDEPFTISGNGKQVRDLLHADDMIHLYLSAIENIDSVNGEAYNIGGGMSNSLSLLELFNLLEIELDVKLNYQKIPCRPSDQKIFVADISKYSKKTKWSPEIDKIKGIRNTISWIMNHNE